MEQNANKSIPIPIPRPIGKTHPKLNKPFEYIRCNTDSPSPSPSPSPSFTSDEEGEAAIEKIFASFESKTQIDNNRHSIVQIKEEREQKRIKLKNLPQNKILHAQELTDKRKLIEEMVKSGKLSFQSSRSDQKSVIYNYHYKKYIYSVDYRKHTLTGEELCHRKTLTTQVKYSDIRNTVTYSLIDTYYECMGSNGEPYLKSSFFMRDNKILSCYEHKQNMTIDGYYSLLHAHKKLMSTVHSLEKRINTMVNSQMLMYCGNRTGMMSYSPHNPMGSPVSIPFFNLNSNDINIDS